MRLISVELGSIFYPCIPGTADESDSDAQSVCCSDSKVEEGHGKENGQDLLDVC